METKLEETEMGYTINYHTGITDSGYTDLDAAKSAADIGAAYTQCDITIEDGDGAEVARRTWYDGDTAEELTDPIRFGAFGYYGDWTETE